MAANGLQAAALHVVFDASCSARVLELAQREATQLAARTSVEFIALTGFGTNTTKNMLDQEGADGYEAIHTMQDLCPCTAGSFPDPIVDAMEETGSDVLFSALVVAVYSLNTFHCANSAVIS